MTKIYITERAEKQLSKLAGTNKRIYEEALDTMDKLQQDNWKGGTRVKKLHGLAEDLYEARLNSGDRMLFTKSGDGICIQMTYVKHEKVKVPRPNITSVGPNAKLIPENETEEDFEIPEEEILKIYTPINTGKVHVIDEETLMKLYDSENITDISLKLKLLPEQEEILHKPLPLLLSGGAGSGKSTISIYRLFFEAGQLLQYEENPKLLYISENKRLIEDAKEQFLYLCRGQDNEERMKNAVDFKSFNTLIEVATFDDYN